MTCQSCVSSVNQALSSVEGIENVDINLEKKQVVVTGRAPPSQVTRALKSTGRQTLIRGSGTTTGEHEGAAVSIIESPLPAKAYDHNSSDETLKVHGIARLIQVSTSPILSLLDVTMRFPTFTSTIEAPGASANFASTQTVPKSSSTESSTPDDESYTLYVAQTGDLTNLTTPPYSTGSPLHTLTTLNPDKEGYADAFVELPIPIWEMVGRAMVVERTQDLKERMSKIKEGQVKKVIGGNGRLGVLAGVIARSAGGELCSLKLVA